MVSSDRRQIAPIDLRNESLLRVLMRGLPHAIRIYDADLACVMANELGRDSETLLPFAENGTRSHLPQTTEQHERWPVAMAMNQGRPVQREYAIDNGDDESRFLDVAAYPIPSPDGKPNLVVEVTRDVTESTIQTAKLKRLDALLSEMVDQLSDVVDTSDNLDGLPDHFDIMPRPETCPNQVSCPMFAPRTITSKKSETVEICARCQIFEMAYPDKLHRLTSSLDGLLATLRRKHRQLLDSQREVLHAERLAAVGELVAGIAHDINNPVGVILSHLDALELETEAGGMPKTLAEDMGVIRIHTQRIANTVEGLLRYCRKTSRRQTLGFDVSRALRESIGFVHDSLTKRGLEIEEHLCDTPLPTLGDPTALQQVFVNLFINAADAMPDGGLLVIHSEEISGEKPFARLTISDTGCGIEPGIIGKVFDPFFTTKQSRGGTGLGLSVCRRIMLELGGDIEVRSTLGEGTTFTLTLPLQATAEVGAQ